MRKIIALILVIVCFSNVLVSANSYEPSIDIETITDEPDISAEYAILIDPDTNTILYEKESHTKASIASMTKLMTILVCMEACGNPKEEKITVSSKVTELSPYSSRCGLRSGDVISCEDLFYGLMLPSGNDAAVALAMHFGGSIDGFAVLMNQKAKELGMHNTNFCNPHGLDEDGHCSTAYDIAILAGEVIKNEDIISITSTVSHKMNAKRNGIDVSWNVRSINFMLSNSSAHYFEGVEGLKTGSTSNAGYCFSGYYSLKGRRMISVVIGSDSVYKRFEDTKKTFEVRS